MKLFTYGIQRFVNRLLGNKFHGVRVNALTKEKIDVEFDEGVWGAPSTSDTPYWHNTSDSYHVRFAVHVDGGYVYCRGHTWKMPEELKEIARDAVEQWLEQTPESEWPDDVAEYYDTENGVFV